MTNIDALFCECKPYCSDGNSLELQKALLDACKHKGISVKADDEYSPENEGLIALAAVKVLVKYLSLSAEHEGEWQQSYNDELEKRIRALCRANGIDVTEYMPTSVTTLRDGSKLF